MNKSRRLRRAEHLARMEGDRSALKSPTGKPTGNRPLGRSRHRWENKIITDLIEIGVNARNWIQLRTGITGEPSYMRHRTCRFHMLINASDI